METSQTETMFHKIADWLPLGLIVTGLLLNWAEVPISGIVLNIGFLLYGVFGLVVSIKRKYHRSFSIRLLKLVNDIAIIVLAFGFLVGENTTWYVLLLILLDRMILTPKSG